MYHLSLITCSTISLKVRGIMNVIKLSQATQCQDFCILIKLYLITMETPLSHSNTRDWWEGEISLWTFLKKVEVTTNAISTLEDILREAISLPKISTPVPLYSHWTRKTGIGIYLLEISQNSLKGNVLSSSYRLRVQLGVRSQNEASEICKVKGKEKRSTNTKSGGFRTA